MTAPNFERLIMNAIEKANAAHMTGPELKSIRQNLGLSVVEFGRALGYEGQDKTVSVTVRRYELGMRDVPPRIERLAFMYGKHGVPKKYLA